MKKFGLLKNSLFCAKQTDQCSKTGKVASKYLIVDRVPNFMSRNDAKKIIHSSPFTAHSSPFTVYRSPHPAFTLAEVLIAIVVIGVVAALVIPSFAMNETQKAYDQAQNVGLIRIREATNQMKTNDALTGYATNDAFADEFAKYMKFGRRCTSANLAKCFAPKFKLPDNTEIDVTTLTTGDKLGHTTYTSNTVGLGLVNGTNMILAFDPACPRIDPYNNTTDTTACLAVIYDINGAGKPNQVGKDITLLNVSISTCSGATIPGGLCVDTSLTSYYPINTCSGGTAADKAFDPTGDANIHCAVNNWAGAKKACAAQQGKRLPTAAELDTMNSYQASFGGFGTNYYWSSTPWNNPSSMVHYFDGGTHIDMNQEKDDNTTKSLCVK